jgi:hypothetical protein
VTAVAALADVTSSAHPLRPGQRLAVAYALRGIRHGRAAVSLWLSRHPTPQRGDLRLRRENLSLPHAGAHVRHRLRAALPRSLRHGRYRVIACVGRPAAAGCLTAPGFVRVY